MSETKPKKRPRRSKRGFILVGDPVINAMIANIPEGNVWPEEGRKQWFLMLEGYLTLAYKDK